MCDQCERVTIDIVRPFEKSEEKLEEAIETLYKAFGVSGPLSDAKAEKEHSPYRAIRELEERIRDRVESRLYDLYRLIVERWLRLSKAEDEVYRLNGKTYLNPQTGKPLTKKEWDQIREDLTRAFTWIYGDEEYAISMKALALGKILHRMDVDRAISEPLSKIDLSKKRIEAEFTKFYDREREFAEQSTARAIVDLTQDSFSKIQGAILEAQRNRSLSRELEQDLFTRFGELNRDWRRIAATETANNSNNGYLLSTLEEAKGERRFMIGNSAPDACDWCLSHVNQQVVILLDKPPKGGGDQVSVDGQPYTAIWPGKSNVGRKRKNWWVAAGTQHPYCRCNWSEYTPGFELYWDKLQASMEQARLEYEERMKP